MEDLADSNHFHRRADHVIMMWRHEEADKFTQLNVAKCKRHDLNGVPGKVWISFDARTCSIVPVGTDPLAVKLERRKAEAQERKRQEQQKADGQHLNGKLATAPGYIDPDLGF